MTLRRTISGLASLHLFFRVDCIVYCEGGEQLSEREIFSGNGDDQTLDVFFWSSISKFLQAKRSYHFKSVGNKAVLKSIAADLDRSKIDSVLVCLDRDYDWLCGKQIESPRVVYSYGYSWESDVVCPICFERLFFRTVTRTPAAEKAMQKALLHFEKFARDLVRWCEADIALFARHLELVLVRDKPMASLDVSGQFPVLNVTRIRAQLVKIGLSRRPRRLVSVQPAEVMRHVWGKLASRFLYHLFVKVVGSQSLRMTYELFMRLMISEMVSTMSEGFTTDKRAYFQSLSIAFS
ncbi:MULTISPECIES: DUF4435 domain-containing protein [unclassified Bradyrhizobium]|uniref:DUF4435 domain-containing protein n=1 Tax=unclassified Bradyrhizobium TaxID=2631580 RepID=UPI002916BD13|nr:MULTISPECIES: DUF4435 domain-containing protein [unclassified Bradyrhizobium]